MKIVLAAVDALADAWERHCGDLPGVTVHRGSILDLSVDAVVRPANSFGFMDGGIDHRYSQRFGWEVQDRPLNLIRVRAAIEEVVPGRGHYPRTRAEAEQRHQLLYTDRVRDLQRE